MQQPANGLDNTGMSPLITPKLPEVLDRRDGESGPTRAVAEQRSGERRSLKERRGTPRLVVMLTLELEHDDLGREVRVVCHTRDLSTSGVAIRGGAAPMPGARVRLRLFLADGSPDPLMLTGEVVGSFDAHGGARVKLDNVLGADRERLERFLR